MIEKFWELTKGKFDGCVDHIENKIRGFLCERPLIKRHLKRPGWNSTLPAHEGIKFFDLVKLHLEDHGYKIAFNQSPSFILVVFNSRIKYWLHSRHNTIAFEIGRLKGPGNIHNLIWTFKISKRQHISHWNPNIVEYYYGCDNDRVLCDLNNPKCLDIILEEIKKHYGSN